MLKNSRIFVAGHQGLVGSAILQNLKINGYNNLITRSKKALDLTDCTMVARFFELEKPEYVFLAAAKVGGIVANNTYRAEFLYENLMIQANVIHQSYLHKVKKLLFMGSTCIYPKNCPQPIKEEYLLTGSLEYTNEPYAIAKIAGMKMCESYNLQYGTNFISVMPTNLYGPKDNFDLENSHVLPALIRKMHLGKALAERNWEAIAEDFNCRPVEGIDGSQSEKEILAVLQKYGVSLKNAGTWGSNGFEDSVLIEIWGSGKPLREFLWSEEMADACVFLMESRDFRDMISVRRNESARAEVRNTHLNIGTGREISIAHLAEIVKTIVKFNGELFFNTEKPDGAFRKLTDVSKLNTLGWKYEVELDEGIYRLYNWYKSSIYNMVQSSRLN
jgi:GDP-L-fucose synthase